MATPDDRITSRPDGHWLTFNNDREIVGCHCGFSADSDSDCGWGDSVVDHIYDAGRASALRDNRYEVQEVDVSAVKRIWSAARMKRTQTPVQRAARRCGVHPDNQCVIVANDEDVARIAEAITRHRSELMRRLADQPDGDELRP